MHAGPDSGRTRSGYRVAVHGELASRKSPVRKWSTDARRCDSASLAHFGKRTICGIATGVLVSFLWRSHMKPTQANKLDVLPGTLDLMVLRVLATMGPQHGYGVARRIEDISERQILLNQGTIYAALVRLQQRGWISADWGVSDNNRRARFYSLTKEGSRQLARVTHDWERLVAVVNRLLAPPGEEPS